MTPTTRFRWTLPIALVIGAVCASLAYWMTRPTSAALLSEAREAVTLRDYERALKLTAKVLERNSESAEALQLRAEAATCQGELQSALEFFRRIPEGFAGDGFVDALKDTGQRLILEGRATDAEYCYRRACTLAPDDLVIHRRLAALYLAQSRRWESIPHLFALVRGQQFALTELAFLGDSEQLYEAEEFMTMFEDSVSDDLAPLMGRARILLFKNFGEDGEALLRKIIAQRPDLIEAQAQLGVVLVGESRDEELDQWHSRLPPEADGHPEIWWVRSTRARKHGDSTGAIRCAYEALKLDPNHLGATYQLAQLFAARGEPEKARLFADRAAKLESLGSTIYEVLLRDPTAERMLRCARVSEELGRLWEAYGWLLALKQQHPDDDRADERDRVRRLLTAATPRTLPEQCLANTIDISKYPEHKWGRGEQVSAGSSNTTELAFRFEDAAPAVGLSFEYRNGARADSSGLMIYQSMGGGVAVIDFDCDGAPDLFFPQASDVPPTAPAERDRLYRNLVGLARDVTEPALPADSEFGFGATIGDWNCDGFPDLYVANLRQNRLQQNNGDGTFSDVTDLAGFSDAEWTISAAVADFNGDGLPDLYDVNYCAGSRPLEHKCVRPDRRTIRTCIPTEFKASADRLLVNKGDGRFEPIGEEAGIVDFDGRSLGVVAANFDSEPGLDLFIANDMTANFLFLNRTPSPGASPRFEETGVISGTAYDSDGRPQACMGVACDDADGDGLIDLFVTNFYSESNTFYRQRPGGFFIDDSRQAKLRNPRLDKLGWGTQFFDADLDGDADLVLVNGHVDNFAEEQIPYLMRSQFYQNLGSEFAEVPQEQLGPFFTAEQLCRGLARLDWNQDGQDDFVVSRLMQPAALVLNRTPAVGRGIGIRLVGQFSRDAIGTEVRVSVGNRTQVKQLTAGDGYQASNERRLVFALGDAGSIDELRIRWQGGAEQVFHNVPAERELLVVEGRDRVLPLRGGVP